MSGANESRSSRKVRPARRRASSGSIAPILYFLAFRLVSQACAFVTGIVIVRALSLPDYGRYAIAISIISVIAVLADSGIGSVALHRASQVTSEAERSRELRAAIGVKSWITATVAIPALLLLTILLLANGTSLSTTIVVDSLVLLSIGPTLTSSVFMVGLQVTDRFRWIRWLDLLASILRLLLVAVIWASGSRSVLLMLSVSLVVLVVQRFVEARVLRGLLPRQLVTAADRSPYWTSIRLTLPTAVLTIVGEQLVLVVLTAVQNSRSIAEIAALGKFAAVFVVLNSLLGTVIAPMLAKNHRTQLSALRRRMRQILLLYALLVGGYVGVSWVLSEPLLLLLGSGYQGLQVELTIVASGVGVSNFAYHAIGSLNHSQGWLRGSWTYVPALGIWLLSSLVIPVDTPTGAATFSAALCLPTLVSQVSRFVIGWRSVNRSSMKPDSHEAVAT